MSQNVWTNTHLYMFSMGVGWRIHSWSEKTKKSLQNNLRSAAQTDHLIFVCWPLEHVSRPLDVEQDVGKDSNGILVTSHHQVGKTHIVIGGDLALGDTRVHTLEDRKQHRFRLWTKQKKNKEMQLKIKWLARKCVTLDALYKALPSCWAQCSPGLWWPGNNHQAVSEASRAPPSWSNPTSCTGSGAHIPPPRSLGLLQHANK